VGDSTRAPKEPNSVGNAAENMSTLRHLALNLLSHEKPEKRDVHVKRLKDALDEKYLPKVLNS